MAVMGFLAPFLEFRETSGNFSESPSSQSSRVAELQDGQSASQPSVMASLIPLLPANAQSQSDTVQPHHLTIQPPSYPHRRAGTGGRGHGWKTAREEEGTGGPVRGAPLVDDGEVQPPTS